MTKILVVDDMAVFREPIAASLRSRGFQTMCAGNGIEALALLRDSKPDLVLLDVAMPEMDGLAMLKRMQEDDSLPECPVILLTAVAERDYVLRARELGVRDYLLKSHFSLEELENRINRCLSGPTNDQVNGDVSKQSTNAPPSSGKSGKEATTIDIPSEAGVPPAGQPGDTAPTDPVKNLKPIVTRSEIDSLLSGFGELKGLSSTVMEVQKLSRSPRSTAEEIASVVRRDQAIALKILKLANSSAYSRGDSVDSLEKAIVRIGLSTIGQAVINLGVIDQFNSESDNDKLDPQLFWEHSIATGLIAARLARETEDLSPDSAFALGLLHDVGKMVYSELLGDRYRQTIHQAHELMLPLERIERRLLLVTHADAMDRVLRSWGFSSEMIDPIVLHHHDLPDIHKLASKRVEQVVILSLANCLAHALVLGSSANEIIYPISELCELLKVDSEIVREIEQSIPMETDEIKFSMLASSTANLWPTRVETWKEQIGCPVRAAFASPDPGIDSYRIFVDRIADRTLEKPNIAVAHLPHTRDRSPVSSALLQAESEMGAANLPLIVLSPHGNIELEERATCDRMVVNLETPTAVALLASTMKELVQAA